MVTKPGPVEKGLTAAGVYVPAGGGTAANPTGTPDFGADDMGLYATPANIAGLGVSLSRGVGTGRTGQFLTGIGMGNIPTMPISISQAQAGFYQIGDQELVDLQTALFQGGFYSKSTKADDVEWGVPDEDTYKGYQTAVVRAARLGLPLSDVLQMAVARNAGKAGKGGRERAPLVVRLTSPEDIQTLSNQVAQQVVGRQLTPEELQRVVVARHGEERRAQTAAYSAATGAGGTVTEAPSTQGAFESEIRSLAPTEAGGHDIANQFSNFLGILKGVS